MNNVTLIGRTNFRRDNRLFGIGQKDKRSHVYVIGKTGTGKTTLLTNMILQDIEAGRGLAFLDPHGDAVESIYEKVKNNPNVIYLNVPDPDQPYLYNPLRSIPKTKRPVAASGMLEIFKKLWKEAWGVRMEHIFRNCLLTLLDQPQADLGGILKLLNDKNYRNQAVRNVDNQIIRDFWYKEFAKFSYRYRADAIAPIQNKVGAFLANPIASNILTRQEGTDKTNLSFRTTMDEGKVLLINLSKGKIGEDASHLLGGLLMTTLGLAAFTRADMLEEKRRDFTLYADEFQNFTTLSIVNMASELRKFRCALVLAHQYLHQLDPDIKEAVLGNAGTLICFRLGAADAVYLEKEFVPSFNRYDLINLPNYWVYLKLMIDGKPSKPFSAETLRARSVGLGPRQR